MSLEIHKMLVLSTAHVMSSTADELEFGETKADWKPAFTREEGWVFYVPGASADDSRYNDAPNDIRMLIEFARDQGVQWLMFDSDGPTVDNLEVYEW